jgi:mannosyltransferase
MLQNHHSRSVVYLLLIMALAGALRCYGTDIAVLSGDEAFSWRLTQYDSASLLSHATRDVHPPLYYVLLKLWTRLVGVSPLGLRGFSACCGVISVAIAFAVSWELHSGSQLLSQASLPNVRSASLFVAFLTAIHLSQVTPGRTARMYSLGIVLIGITT